MFKNENLKKLSPSIASVGSRLPIWDILLYVKLYLNIQGDDLLLAPVMEGHLC